MTDLIGFERAAYSQAPDRVGRMLAVLRAMAVGKLIEDSGRPDASVNPNEIIHRLAGAIAAVLADPAIEVSPVEVERLLVLGNTLTQVFRASGFGGLDYLFRIIDDIPLGAPIGQVNKRYAMLSLDSVVDCTPQLLSKAPPRLAWLALANLISTKPIATRRGEQQRDRLLANVATMPAPDIPLHVDHLVLIASAWMLCSYSALPGKHAIKARLNEGLRDMALRWGLRDASLPDNRPLREKPVMLFAAEIMHSGHVQYRYFGQYLRQLRKRFKLVLLTEAREADSWVVELFDELLTFERGDTPAYLGDIARMIAKTAPDILFYPSVGMRHWGPLFANLRLAPIQMTALGHSASTFCDTIDYYLLEEGYVSDPALFSETVITVPDDSLVFERAPRYTPIAPSIREAPQRLKIALPSNALKLNPTFLSVVARICREAERPIELAILPNVGGIELSALRKLVSRILPNATVHGMLSYERYLAALSSCDLNLSPFPFGGLHSVIDSLRQGLPVVAMDCPEPHGRTDAMLLRRLGMPDWLIARDEEEYIAAALRVIRDDELRVELSGRALALDIDHVMFGDATTPLRSDVEDAVWWIYTHHEQAMNDGRKLWSPADRQTLTGEASR